jgi:hypothetical protein
VTVTVATLPKAREEQLKKEAPEKGAAPS